MGASDDLSCACFELEIKCYHHSTYFQDGPVFRVDRIKCLGNGVVPQQVQKAFETLMGLR